MKSIAIVYYSASGTTHSLAEAIQYGINTFNSNAHRSDNTSGIASDSTSDSTSDKTESKNNVAVHTYRILPEHIHEGRFLELDMLASISQADGIIFGSPTYMGSVAAQFKAFIDATSSIWAEGGWTNKIAAAFTVGGSYSGDQLSTIQYLHILANQHGMLWAGLDGKGLQTNNVPNISGANSGLIIHAHNNKVPKNAFLTAQYLGQRVAKLINQLHQSV